VLGNTGSIIAHRVGADDAAAPAPEFGIPSPSAFTDLANYEAWARLPRDGAPTDAIPLSFDVPEVKASETTEAVIARTRARYTRPRRNVEDEIARFIARPLPMS